MVEKKYEMIFDEASSSRPYTIQPKVFSDNRGTFSEVLVDKGLDSIKQINRSTSCQWTIRGCHAQKAPHCQSKLVEALTIPIYDIITDARPDSKSFGLTEAYYLDPKTQNKLFVPHGFLHAFAVPEDEKTCDATFMYYCDDVYSKEDEVCVNPMSILPVVATLWSKETKDEANVLFNLVKMLESPEKLVLSEKDLKGKDYKEFMEEVSKEYRESKKLWYKG